MKINSIGIHIKAKNFEKSLSFYQALGFRKVFAYGPDEKIKEDYRGTVFEHGGCKFEIADGHRAVKPAVFQETVSSSKISLMIAVDSMVEMVDRCVKEKIEVAVPVRHYYWGTLELVVKDPDGVVLVFVCPYSEDEARLVDADESWMKK